MRNCISHQLNRPLFIFQDAEPTHQIVEKKDEAADAAKSLKLEKVEVEEAIEEKLDEILDSPVREKYNKTIRHLERALKIIQEKNPGLLPLMIHRNSDLFVLLQDQGFQMELLEHYVNMPFAIDVLKLYVGYQYSLPADSFIRFLKSSNKEAAIEAIMEIQPNGIIRVYSEIKEEDRLPGMEQMLRRAVEASLTKKGSHDIFRYPSVIIDNLKDEEGKMSRKEIFMRAAELVPFDFFLQSDRKAIKSLSYLGEMARLAAKNLEKRQYFIIENQAGFFKLPEVAAVFEAGVEIDPLNFIENFEEKYRSKLPKANELLKKAFITAVRSDDEEFQYKIRENFDLLLKQSYDEEILILLAKREPFWVIHAHEKLHTKRYWKRLLRKAVFFAVDGEYAYALLHENIKIFEKESYYLPVLKRVAEKAINEKPGAVLSIAKRLKKTKFGPVLVDKAIANCLKEQPKAILEHFEQISERKGIEELLDQAASQSKDHTYEVLSNIEKFREMARGRQLIKDEVIKSAKEDASLFFVFLDKIVAMKDSILNGVNIDDLILQAMKTARPYWIMSRIELYADKAFAKLQMLRAVRLDPEKAMKYHLDKILKLSFASEVLFELAIIFPGSIFEEKNSKKIKMLPDAKDIFVLASQRDPWSFRAHVDELRDVFENIDEQYKKAEERISEANTYEELPKQYIRPQDFPISRGKIVLITAKMNHERRWGASFNTIPIDEFENMLSSVAFQQIMKKKLIGRTYMNAFSLAHATHRRLERAGLPKDENNIKKAAETILQAWEKIGTRELFGPHTKLILFTHEEKRFINEEIVQHLFVRSGGKEKNIVSSEKGFIEENGKNAVKERTLQAIAESSGDTTILFSGHGGPKGWYFSQGQPDSLNYKGEGNPVMISYKEMGDALIESGNISNINIIGCTCNAYVYMMNVFAHIESKGIFEKPAVTITEANKEQFGYGGGWPIDSRLLSGMMGYAEANKPLTVQQFFDAEADVWTREDPAVFVPSSKKEIKRLEKEFVPRRDSKSKEGDNLAPSTEEAEKPLRACEEINPVRENADPNKKEEAEGFLEISAIEAVNVDRLS